MSVAQVLDAGEELLKAAIERSGRFGDKCEVVFWRSAEDAWGLWCGQIPDTAANKPVVLVLVSAVSAGVTEERTQDLLSISSFLAFAVLRGLVSPARRWTVLDLERPDPDPKNFRIPERIRLSWQEAGGEYVLVRCTDAGQPPTGTRTLGLLLLGERAIANAPPTQVGIDTRSKTAKGLLDFLAERIRALGGSHHTSANLLSPLLLRNVFSTVAFGGDGAMPEAWNPDRVLDELCGNLCQSLREPKEQWIDDKLRAAVGALRASFNKLAAPNSAQPVTLRVVLIDDDHARGYGKFVEAACAQLSGADSGLVWSLSEQDRFTEMSVEGLAAAQDADIVLLDLRLWHDARARQAPRDVADSKRLTVLRQWYRLGKAASANGDAAQILADLQAEIDSGDAERAKNLAFWPRMLSVLSPALPIIVFSSTQQRAVVHAVRELPNVLTGFSKPYFETDDEDARDPVFAARCLLEELVRAAELSHIQRVSKCARSIDPVKVIEDGLALGPGIDRARFLGWLESTWIPEMQRGNYRLAQALPWLFLEGELGAPRLDMFRKHASISVPTTGQLLELIARLRVLAFSLSSREQGRRNAPMQAEVRAEEFARALLGGFALCQLFTESGLVQDQG